MTFQSEIESAFDESLKIASSIDKRCYCCLLYGSSTTIELLSKALAMAHSLRNSKYPLIILMTPDVSNEIRQIVEASGLFSELRVVDYILAHVGLFKKDWFREVFTKLHIFNLVDYCRVIFLDLDVIVNTVPTMDQLFDSGFGLGAMENSKGSPSSGSMWLKHGELMGRNCRLINAGVMLVCPNKQLFELLREHVSSASDEHIPGMTPEQTYLARIFRHRFHHISQIYNMEVQYHGGVPVTSKWLSASFDETVLFHFSGGNPFERIWDGSDSEWACQTEKRMVKEKWFIEFNESERKFANERARLAFGKWAFHFASALLILQQSCFDFHESEMLSKLEVKVDDDQNMILSICDETRKTTLIVNTANFSVSFPRPARKAPSLIDSVS